MGEEVVKVRMPQNNEVFGVVDDTLGGSRFKVICSDGKVRVCRISGKFKRSQWIIVGDIVLVKPWDVQGDERGDIVWKYRIAEAEWLRSNGYIKFC